MNKIFSRVRLSLTTIALLVFFLTLSIALTIWNIPMYLLCLHFSDIPKQVNMSLSTILENYIYLLKYLHIPWMTDFNLPDFTSSASGVFHFYEVKKLFYLNYICLLLSGTYAGLSIFNLRKQKRFYSLEKPFKILSFLPILVIILLSFFFEKIFILFHQIFFDNNAWLFNPSTDPIINVLPQNFFMLCFLQVFILFQIGIILVWYFAKKNRLKSSIDKQL